MTTPRRFLGNFKIRDDNNEVISYNVGDVVDYQGKQYIATKPTSGFSPLVHESRSGWTQLLSGTNMNFTNSDTEPEIAYEGDHWFNSSTGQLLIYIKDKDSEQWVEL